MKLIPVLLIAAVVLAAGCASQAPADTTQQTQPENEEATVGTGGNSNTPDTAQNEPDTQPGTQNPSAPAEAENLGTYGVELARNYYRFNSTHYFESRQKNMNFETMILLHFTADNCEYCNEQEAVFREAFNSLNYDNIIGYEVHYEDSETNDEDRAVSEEFTQDYWNRVGPDSKIILDKYQTFRRSTDRYTVETAIAVIEDARDGFYS